MTVEDADDLVQFQAVRVIRSTAAAVLCRIGDRSVWLPRRHIRGKLWCTGDRGKLFIRRWVARDRQLIDPEGVAISPLVASIPRPQAPSRLYLVRRGRYPHLAN
jgi:hypothetical protein